MHYGILFFLIAKQYLRRKLCKSYLLFIISVFLSAKTKELEKEEMNEEENVRDLIELQHKKLAEPRLEVLRNFKYPIYQPSEPAEFPHVVNGTIRIPHIIHQICNTASIPDNFLLAMRSFVKYNPTWEYRFWTYKSGHNFLRKYHPYLVDIYDSFGENDVKKSDLLRLAVLYEYGGVYADLDVSNVRSLNITTTKYACIIPTEPFEHAGLLYRQEFVLTTSVLLCRPKHPFFERLLLQLQIARPRGHPVTTTGPAFLTGMYLKYNNITWSDVSVFIVNGTQSNAPYFFKGHRDEENDDAIYIPNGQYFGDKIDPSWINGAGELKACGLTKETDIHTLRSCKEFESRKAVRKEKLYTFTVHHWFHWWVQGEDFNKFLQTYDIKEVIPKAILFEE
jgi:mannosyltransferase OCH1-like enzyme